MAMARTSDRAGAEAKAGTEVRAGAEVGARDGDGARDGAGVGAQTRTWDDARKLELWSWSSRARLEPREGPDHVRVRWP